MKRAALNTLFSCVFLLSAAGVSSAATAQQELGAAERTRELQQKEERLREQIEKEPAPAEIEDKTPPPAAPAPSEEKVFIKDISVTGSTLIPQEKINSLIAPYKNKELTLNEIRVITDKITDLYRVRGFITSRAYLPPQKLEGGVLEIKVLEAKIGDIEVRNNRYFKSGLLISRMALKKGEPFNYNRLREGISLINQHPDRFAKAVLAPGKEPGTTDIILDVKDRLPLHLGVSGDNFASRYLDKQRYIFSFTHNNLLGFDDRMSFQYQMGQAGRYFLKNISYSAPFSKWQVGGYATFARVKLGQEFEDQDVRGKTQVYGVFASRSLIRQDNYDLTLNLGYDYKNVVNTQNQAVTSHDRIRMAKLGADFSATDNWGRTIVSNEIDFGIPDIMGGLSMKDPRSSRDGAGGQFTKDTLDILRLQKMPFSSTLLWKNQFQITGDILTATEQFQVGGIANVRGYPPAEAVGDRGIATTAEWSFPPYFVPKDFKVPFSKARFYDAFRTAVFYDWANAFLRRPGATEEKYKTLSSLGCGIRFNLPEDFSLRVDLAWPLDNTPSDSDHMRPWVQVSKNF